MPKHPPAELAPGPHDVHFVTCVLNGQPFVGHHIEQFRRLTFAWHWHIVEGVVGPTPPDSLHRGGRSIDGTSEYLDRLVAEFPDRVTIYRKPEGEFWASQREMLSLPLERIGGECLLWRVDAEELWTAEQFEAGQRLFVENPGKTAALYWCWYFVGPGLVTSTRHCYGNDPRSQWVRTWRYRPGMRWLGEGPEEPALCEAAADGRWRPVHATDALSHEQTEAAGLVFQLWAFATEEQVRRKQAAGDLPDALERWRALQRVETFPVKLRSFFSWVEDDTEVDRAEHYVARPLAGLPPSAGDDGRDPLPLHFFTIVLNGEPFVRYHIDQFKDLPFAWHWHVVEGVASLTHDTAWAVPLGGRVMPSMHRDGRSTDGTSAYLDELKARYPDNVTIYRKPPGEFWDGKREMVSAPLANIAGEALLWELDVDEFWTAEQFRAGRALFLAHPDRTAAFYWCWYFVGPRLLTANRGTFANNPAMEWLRTWRYRPGMRWAAHEPPVLVEPIPGGRFRDVARVHPFMHAETEAAGLVFQHFSYVTLEQLWFKELYYGYRNTTWGWLALQSVTRFPVPLRSFFPWVGDGTMIDTAERLGVRPIWELPSVFAECPSLESAEVAKATVT